MSSFYSTGGNGTNLDGKQLTAREYNTYQSLMNSTDPDDWSKARAMSGSSYQNDHSDYTYTPSEDGVNTGTFTRKDTGEVVKVGNESGNLNTAERWAGTNATNKSTSTSSSSSSKSTSSSQPKPAYATSTQSKTSQSAQTSVPQVNTGIVNTQGVSSSAKLVDDGSGKLKIAEQSSFNTPRGGAVVTTQATSSTATDALLPQTAQTQINQYKKIYTDAAAKGDWTTAQAARDAAERIRNNNGYYSSPDGSILYPIDQGYVDKQVEFAKAAYLAAEASGDFTGMTKAHDAAEYYRGLMGYSGGTDGSGNYKLKSDGSVDYSGMSYSEMWTAAKAVGDKYTMAYAANEADKQRRQSGVYGGSDGAAGIPVDSTKAKIEQLNGQLQQAYASGDAKQATILKQEITKLHNSIGEVECDDGSIRTVAELNFYIEQQKKAYNDAIANHDTTAANTAHENAVWADKQLGNNRNADGSVSTATGYTMKSGMSFNNEPINVSVDANGKIKGIYNADGTINTDYRGLVTVPYGTSTLQWIVHTDTSGQQSFVKVDPAAKSSFYEINADGSMNEKTAVSAGGNTLRTNDFVYGADGYSYDRETGKSLAELASEYGLTSQNFVQKITYGSGKTKFYNLNGVDVTWQYNTVQNGTMRDYANDTLDASNNLMASVGFNNVPQIKDYNTLSWEEALKRAEEQVNGKYSEKLDYNLNKLNNNALQTGFYGQLPTEALKQQAVASTEVDRQQAVYDLATQLMEQSQAQAQQMYQDDMTTTQQRLDTLTTIFNQVYQAIRDGIKDKQTERQLDIQQNANDIQQNANDVQHEANLQNYNINLSSIWAEVISAYTSAYTSGLGVPGVISNAVQTAYNRLTKNWK